VVELPGAHDETRHGFVVRCCVVDHRPEGGYGETTRRRRRLLQPQEALRRHDDERARCRIKGLASKQVEVLARRGGIRDADVLLSSELEEALQTRTRMLGAVALVSVREQKREPR